MHEAAGRSPESAGDATSTAPAPAADGERILLLECRLEQLRSALDGARSEADAVRLKLAEAAAREADHARRHSLLHQELAEARAELVSLHERLDRSEALRAELEGHLFEAGARGDAAELVRLRREVLAQRQRSVVSERTSARLRARVDELLLSRETLLTRMAEWQRLVQKEGPAAADLAEFMAELRRDILHLEHRNATGERQEAALRERLVRAGLDPDEPAAAYVPAALVELSDDEPAAEFLSLDEEVTDAELDALAVDPPSASTAAPREGLTSEVEEPVARDSEVTAEEREAAESTVETAFDSRKFEPAALGEEASAGAVDAEAASDSDATADANSDAEVSAADLFAATHVSVAVPPRAPEREDPIRTEGVDGPPVEGLRAADPSTRAAAYERLTRVLEDDPARLARHLRPGLADPHPRVRRRAVLAAATAPRLPVRALLEPLRSDPDPHVRRVVREVLRHARSADAGTESEDEAVLVSMQAAPGTRS